MGVLGLTTLLQQHGWMPKRRGCTNPVWRDTLLDDNLADRIEMLPPNSTLAVDGNGLAHYLHEVAYSRYFGRLTLVNHTADPEECSCKKDLSKELVIQCLPQSMPLQVLDEVTREFVTSLQKNHLKLVIYWDGRGRRMKAATSKKRRSKHSDEWSNLYQFCQFGTLPFRSPCLRNFTNNFPQSRLLMQQVQSTLSTFTDIDHIHCEEEADREIAMASARAPDTYCVGMDSDFCLFPDTKYVPLSTINASGTVVTGCVITRDALADLFHLPSSESVVEMGILMGNDYVGNAKLDYHAKSAEEAIDYLQLKGDDYRVRSSSDSVQLALDFTRALYSFQPLDDYPIDQRPSVREEKDDDDDTPEDRPMLPDSLDLSLVDMQPVEFSLRAVVIRPLQAYIDQSTDDAPMVTQQQLDAFVELNTALELNLDRRTVMVDRPNWRDILAAYAIEKCISHVFREYAGSPVVRYSSPMKMFDQLTFESMMNTQRKAIEKQILIEKQASSTSNGTSGKDKKAGKGAPAVSLRLPIDEFEGIILDSINTHRVTIIHGETGCGKSSRVPVMILRAPVPNNSHSEPKIFISQPRRIAAKSLVERVRSCEPDVKDKIALRMGHGEREYESSQTRAWFVTTGYLVRVLANHPERFNDVSHLIIDEVHERSVDSDILCLLCKRLLKTNLRIRLVLMSATLAANMYAGYFGVTEPPIQVGGRKFPIREFFVEDLVSTFKFPAKDQKSAKVIRDQCEKSKCRTPPSNTYMESLYQLAVRTVAAVGQPGSSVLVFVTGMNDIISIIDLIEKLYVPGARYTCFPIHSDVPFEEQMAAFDKPAPDEIKVVIGTNAAESGITLPDVDHVVCLGLQKQIVYNAASHRQLLTPAWISRANAIQRAGRTGRVRNGNVYRLYTRKAFDEYMAKFEIGEMSRVPLDSVILDLKEMLHEEATPVLLDCLEPPELRTIERSFESLHAQRFLTEPDDSGDITNLGSFVASLGIDLMLGSLIGLGIQFGVGAEAIEIAAILSFAKSPWIISNSLFHESPEFNDLTSRTFTSRCHFDANLYSDPLAIMNLLWDYERISNKKSFGWQFSLALARVRRLLATRNSIRSRVADFLGCDVEKCSISEPPSRMPHAKVVLLRIIQVWVSHDNIIQAFQVANASEDSVMVTLRKNLIEDAQLKQVLDEKRHPFQLITHKESETKGNFTLVEQNLGFASFLDSFDDRYISYCAENAFNMAWYRVDNDLLVLIVRDIVAESSSIMQMREDVLAGVDEYLISATPHVDSNNRGRNGRACGLWKIELNKRGNGDEPNGDNSRQFVRFSTNKKDKINKLAKFLKIKSLQTAHVDKTIACQFFLNASGKKKKCISPGYSFFSRGQCDPVTKQDAVDLFSTSELTMSSRQSGKPTQEVRFNIGTNSPLAYSAKNGKDLSGSSVEPSSSWKRPLLNDIPEGARVMSVVASSRRPEHYINFSSTDAKDDKLIKVEMSRTESRIADRWTTFGTGRSVYVETNCVPAASLSIDGPVEVFAVAGDSLELKGGALRVTGLTLLPPGRLFLLLCLKTFGLHPLATSFGDEDEELDQCLGWLQAANGMVTLGNIELDDMADRTLKAIGFHESSAILGEKLVCYPEFVSKLLSIFNEVDGYECSPWDELFHTGDEPTKRPQKSQRKKTPVKTPVARFEEASSSGAPQGGQLGSAPNTSAKKKKKSKSQKQAATETMDSPQPEQLADKTAPSPDKKKTAPSPGKKKAPEATLVTQFSKKAHKISRRIFALNSDESDAVGESDLPSTNLLCMLVEFYRNAAETKGTAAVAAVPAQWAIYGEIAQTVTVTQDEPVALVPNQWRVYRVPGGNGNDWYSATFIGSMIPLIPLEGRSGIPAWMKGDLVRPSKSEDALNCVPSHVAARLTYWTKKVTNGGSEEETMIMFPNLETALRMAAAYWLERQFLDRQRHWYEVSFNEMVQSSVQNL